MKLYMVSRTDRSDYDQYSDVVVRAKDAEAAKQIVLTSGEFWDWDDEDGDYSGCPKPCPMSGFTDHNITVEPLPVAGAPGVVLGSFHAG